jgi:hypothetical protein
VNVFSVAAPANVAVRAGNHELFAGTDHVNRDPAFRPATITGLNVAECIELVLSDNDLRADVDATIQIDHVVVDETEAAG